VKKIDKTLKEVRSWKRKVAAKTRGMTREQILTYFNSAKDLLPLHRKRRTA
jgi:hypothetical protein